MKLQTASYGPFEAKALSCVIDVEVGATTYPTQDNLSFTKIGVTIKQINTVKVSMIIDLDDNFTLSDAKNLLTSGEQITASESAYGSFVFVPTRARFMEKGDFPGHISLMLEGEIGNW